MAEVKDISQTTYWRTINSTHRLREAPAQGCSLLVIRWPRQSPPSLKTTSPTNTGTATLHSGTGQRLSYNTPPARSQGKRAWRKNRAGRGASTAGGDSQATCAPCSAAVPVPRKPNLRRGRSDEIMIVSYNVDNTRLNMHDSSVTVAATEGRLYNIVACCSCCSLGYFLFHALTFNHQPRFFDGALLQRS